MSKETRKKFNRLVEKYKDEGFTYWNAYAEVLLQLDKKGKVEFVPYAKR
jgi:hypothetical protein